MSLNTKMTAIADEVRELSGTTEKIGLDIMATNLDEANSEVATQADLLVQITNALKGKAAGGGNNGENLDTVIAEQDNLIEQIQTALEGKTAAGITLPELYDEGIATDLMRGKQLINSEGYVVTGVFSLDTELAEQDRLIAKIIEVVAAKLTTK